MPKTGPRPTIIKPDKTLFKSFSGSPELRKELILQNSLFKYKVPTNVWLVVSLATSPACSQTNPCEHTMVMTYICKTTRKTKAVKRTVSTPFFAGLCAHLAILPPASRVPDMCWYDCEEQDRVASKVFLNTFL